MLDGLGVSRASKEHPEPLGYLETLTKKNKMLMPLVQPE